MNRIIPQLLVSVFFCLAVFLWGGCNKCRNVDCENGTCVKGECVCEFGWEGTDCSTAFRDKFIGTWSGDSYCNSGVSNFVVVISAGTANDLSLDITNLYNSGETVTGEIVAADRIDIPVQNLGSTTVVGNGTYHMDTGLIQIFYTVGSSIPAEDCVVELTQP